MRKSYSSLQRPQRWTMKEDRPMLAAVFFVSPSVHCPLSYCKIGEPQCFMATLSALERGLSSNDKIKSMLGFFLYFFLKRDALQHDPGGQTRGSRRFIPSLCTLVLRHNSRVACSAIRGTSVEKRS